MSALLAPAAGLLLGLVAAGALLPVNHTRAAVLASLLLVPDVPSGRSFGLLVHWSAGLTLSNFVVPALALPLLLGAWLAGKPLLPRRWPPLARWSYLLLAWGALTLLPPWFSGALAGGAAWTIAAHWVKLALFLGLGVVLAGGDAAWRSSAGRWFAAAVALNAVVGLAQAAGWLPALSPLAAGGDGGPAARASGLFYDANMYAVLMAWALLWLCHSRGRGGLQSALRWTLLAAVAAAVAAAGSRAGYAALAAGALVLLCRGERRAVAALAGLALAAFVLAPALTWGRLESSAATVLAAGAGPSAGADSATADRLASMRKGLRQVAAHPWLGSGFGRALYLGVPPVRGGEGPFQGAQNMELTVLAATGPVGLGLLLAAMGATALSPLSDLCERHAHLAGYVGLLVSCITIEILWNARILSLLVVLTGADI